MHTTTKGCNNTWRHRFIAEHNELHTWVHACDANEISARSDMRLHCAIDRVDRCASVASADMLSSLRSLFLEEKKGNKKMSS